MRHKILFIVLYVIVFSTSLFARTPVKVLLVVAHPDDEYYFAATTYRLAMELHETVDELIITNGAGGFRYSTFAEPFYQKALTTETVGRRELPAIRREEALRAGKIIGIRDHYFLDQKDQKFTTDSLTGLKNLWDTRFITNTIVDLIRGQRYQYVFTVLPRSTTHGHHQAATILASRAIHSLPDNLRPILLGFDTDGSKYVPLTAVTDTREWASDYSFVFDRTAPVGFHNELSYQIVVSWMISEHKSQGLLQTLYDKDPKEYVWVDPESAPRAQSTASSLFKLLAPVAASGRKPNF